MARGVSLRRPTAKERAKRAEFQAAFTDCIVAWNVAESGLRRLLLMICGPTVATYILTAELGGVALSKMTQVVVKRTQPPDVVDAIIHAIKFYDRVREYRNHYVHGIYFVSFHGEKIFASVEISSNKKSAKSVTDHVYLEDLIRMRDWSLDLSRLLSGIQGHLEWCALRQGLTGPTPIPLPVLPILPDPIDKTRRYPLVEPVRRLPTTA